jgi:hypothetical protein
MPFFDKMETGKENSFRCCCSVAEFRTGVKASFKVGLEGGMSHTPFNPTLKMALKALTDHLEGGSRVYAFDPYW